MRHKKPYALYCFSPPVMLATFATEIILAGYVWWKYTLTNITRLAVAILGLLAVFQLAEYNICEGSFGISGLDWSRVGYVAITLLPPLGLHLALRLAGKKKRLLIASAYTTAGLFAAFFAFSGHGITSQACLGNYVIFDTAPGASTLYGVYYYGWLLVGTFTALYLASRTKLAHNAAALRALALGYVSFILPTTTANVLNPSTLAGIPSIMCGFAVILAVILAGEVLPQYYRESSLTHIMKLKRIRYGRTSK